MHARATHPVSPRKLTILCLPPKPLRIGEDSAAAQSPGSLNWVPSVVDPEVPKSSDPSPDSNGNATQEMPTLPTELLSCIVKFTLEADMTMLGVFNRVSYLFGKLASQFHPQIYIRETLAESLDLNNSNDNSISLMWLYKSAGYNSGLAMRLKELFKKNKKWIQAWVVLKSVGHGQYKITDIYWKT